MYHQTHNLSDASKKFTAKLAPKYEGPSKIIQILSPSVLMLQVPNRRKPVKVHVKDIKIPSADELQADLLPPIPQEAVRDVLD